MTPRFLPREPLQGELIRTLGPDGELSLTHTRVKQIISHDRREELWEVLDNINRTRIITESGPREWMEVQW